LPVGGDLTPTRQPLPEQLTGLEDQNRGKLMANGWPLRASEVPGRFQAHLAQQEER
jgi:hypothetical protein